MGGDWDRTWYLEKTSVAKTGLSEAVGDNWTFFCGAENFEDVASSAGFRSMKGDDNRDGVAVGRIRMGVVVPDTGLGVLTKDKRGVEGR